LTFSGARPLTSALICTWMLVMSGTASIGRQLADQRPLGMNAADVCQDVEGIEYHISRLTLEAIDALAKALRKHPFVLAEVLKCGRSG
jgi:Iron dependent repressor, metal binding and dimerisation domain